MSAALAEAAHPPAAVADGLPGPLPDGERILWQGAPVASALARRALHARLLLAYFAALTLYAAVSWGGGRGLGEIARAVMPVVAGGVLVLLLIRVFAELVARTTRYTITTRRVVMRVGVALPITLNLPFAVVTDAAVKLHGDGTGDIPIAFGGDGRIGFLHLWPHARPWRVGRPQPMLRCVPDAGQVAAILARALGGGPLGRAAAARQDAITDACHEGAAATAA